MKVTTFGWMATVAFVIVPIACFGDTWTDTVPAHMLGCSTSVPVSDVAATEAGIEKLLATFDAAKLLPGAAEPVLSDANPQQTRLCLQLGDQSVPKGAAIETVQVSERTAALTLCSVAALGDCRTKFIQDLGDRSRGLLYAVALLNWVNPNCHEVECAPLTQLPAKSSLAALAAGLTPMPTQPEEASELRQTHFILVAPLNE